MLQETYELVRDSLPALMAGAATTLELVIIALIIGFVLAVPLALMRTSKNPIFMGAAYGYIFYFRGTPLLVQIYLTYYGLGQFEAVRESFLWPIFREAYWCAIIAFSLNTAAYTAEIFRGAIQAVPHGEIEAARAVGMSRFLQYRRIILPSAFRLALPAYSNEVILMLKSSSLASTITLLDLTGVARVIVSRTFAPYEIFITAAIIYLLITFVVTRGFAWTERRLNPQLKRPDEPKATATWQPEVR